jgi:hypothetical protein
MRRRVVPRRAALPVRALVAGLAREPQLVPDAWRVGRALAPAGWWRRPPFLPLPDRAWIAFRLETAYGDPSATAPAEDLLAFLAWCGREVRAQSADRRIRRRAGAAR